MHVTAYIDEANDNWKIYNGWTLNEQKLSLCLYLATVFVPQILQKNSLKV